MLLTADKMRLVPQSLLRCILCRYGLSHVQFFPSTSTSFLSKGVAFFFLLNRRCGGINVPHPSSVWSYDIALWMLCHELPDLLVLALTQPELGCRDRLFYLAGMTCADNRCSDRRIVQCPGDGNNPCRDLM